MRIRERALKMNDKNASANHIVHEEGTQRLEGALMETERLGLMDNNPEFYPIQKVNHPETHYGPHTVNTQLAISLLIFYTHLGNITCIKVGSIASIFAYS